MNLDEAAQKLLENIKENLPELEALLEQIGEGSDPYEDGMYRFYHQSFKVYGLQHATLDVCKILDRMRLNPAWQLNPWFAEIVERGTREEFHSSHNENWPKHTRPIVEAFLHAQYFLKMAVKYGRKYDEPPEVLDYGWAALLELYKIR